MHPNRDFFDRVIPLDGVKPFRAERQATRWVVADANVFIYALRGDRACGRVLDRAQDEGRLATTGAVLDEVHGGMPWTPHILAVGDPDPVFVDQDVGNGKTASAADLSLLQATIEHAVDVVLTYDSDLLRRAVGQIVHARTGRHVVVQRAGHYRRAQRHRRHRAQRNPTSVVMPRRVTA